MIACYHCKARYCGYKVHTEMAGKFIDRDMTPMSLASSQPHNIVSGRQKADDWGLFREVNRRRRSRRGIRETTPSHPTVIALWMHQCFGLGKCYWAVQKWRLFCLSIPLARIDRRRLLQCDRSVVIVQHTVRVQFKLVYRIPGKIDWCLAAHIPVAGQRVNAADDALMHYCSRILIRLRQLS